MYAEQQSTHVQDDEVLRLGLEHRLNTRHVQPADWANALEQKKLALRTKVALITNFHQVSGNSDLHWRNNAQREKPKAMGETT